MCVHACVRACVRVCVFIAEETVQFKGGGWHTGPRVSLLDSTREVKKVEATKKLILTQHALRNGARMSRVASLLGV